MDNNEYVEIKVKWADEQVRKWEDIPVMCQMTLSAVLSTTWNKDIWEVRYNLPGSQQGHYIPCAKMQAWTKAGGA